MDEDDPDEILVYKNKLFVQGLKPNTSDRDIGGILHKCLRQKPKDIQRSKSGNGSFIATFPHRVDLSYTIHESKFYETCQGIMDLVPISNSIWVSQLPHLTDDELQKEFKIYFDQQKIHNIKFEDDRKAAVISFTTETDVEEMCRRCKTINAQDVEAEVFHWQLWVGRNIVTADVFIATEEELHFLQDSVITRYIVKKIRNQELNGHWKRINWTRKTAETDQWSKRSYGKLKAYAENDSHAAAISHILAESIVKISVKLDKESIKLMTSNSWQEHKGNIHRNTRNKVNIFLEKQNLISYSTDADAGLVKEVIQDFLNANTVTETKLSTAACGTLENQGRLVLRQVEYELQNEGVKIDVAENAVTIRGTDLGVSKAKRKVEDILRSAEQIDIETFDASGVSQRATCVTKQNRILVMAGDITELKVDAILSLTNKRMRHIVGLAKTFVNKGGPTIQEECNKYVKEYGELKMCEAFCSSAGRLKCRHIIHSVGPVWQDGKHDEGENLWKAIMNSIELACDRKFSSIAMPTLGAGVNGASVEESTNIICDVIRQFYKERKGKTTSLRTIYLCDVKSKNADAFIESLENIYGKEAVNKTDYDSSKMAWEKHQIFVQTEIGRYLQDGFSFILMEGNITDLDVNVIVNLADETLRHDVGLTKEIADKAGGGVEEQCKHNSHLKEGEMFCSSAGNLPSSFIMHAVCPLWKDGNSQENEMLNQTVQKCLNTANSKKCKSIAFPVFDWGFSSTPPDVMISVIMDTVLKFYASTSQPDLVEIYLCCHRRMTEICKEKIKDHLICYYRGDGQSWRNHGVTKTIPIEEEGICKLLKQPEARQYLVDKLDQTLQGKYEIQIGNYINLFVEDEVCAAAAEDVVNGIFLKVKKSIRVSEKKRKEIAEYCSGHPGKLYVKYHEDAVVFFGIRDIIISEGFKQILRNDTLRCVIL